MMDVEGRGLHFAYNKNPILNGLDIALPRQSVYGLLGKNGAGKTTLIKILLGLLRPGAGVVNILNRPFETDRISILKHVGALVEMPVLYQHLTAAENLEYFASFHQLRADAIAETLSWVGLAHTGKKKVSAFSMGMKQRLGIGIAILHDPQILFLDEPTVNLDPQGINWVRALISSLADRGKTILLSSHNLPELEKVCTRIGVIKGGRMIFEGQTSEIQKKVGRRYVFHLSDLSRLKGSDGHLKYEWINEHTVSFNVKGQSEFSSIIHHLSQKGIDILDIDKVDNNKGLEEIFLQLTKDEDADYR